MRKIYFLKSCSTCKRVMKDFNLGSDFILQDIKEQPITEAQIEELKNMAGSYEKIFSKIAMKYRILGLHQKTLSELEYKNYILQEYTFIKRPILVVDGKIFIGSARPNLMAAKAALESIK